MKATDLRKAILQAAVQGKLVPQDKNDEPASELLKRIQAEKVALIKEGKLKKEKPLPPIAEDEIPYDLPDGWTWCRLGLLCTFVNGDRSKNYPSGTDLVKSGIPFINSKNIMGHEICLDDSQLTFITESKFRDLRAGALIDCDIVFVLRGSVGKFGIFHACPKYCTGFVNAQIVIVRALQKEFVRFILCFFESNAFADLMQRVSTGSAVAQLSANNLSTILFPLPPLAEQQRIVAQIDKLMTMCDELEAAEKELDALEDRFAEYLPKSILQSAVQGKLVAQDKNDEPAAELLKRIQKEKAQLVKDGKLKKEKPLPPIAENELPYDLPDGWTWCRLSTIAAIVGGATPQSTNDEFYTAAGSGISWITPADMKNCTVDKMIYHGQKDITEAGYNSCSTILLPKGSVLYSSRAPIGLIAFAGNALCTNQGFKSLIPVMSDMAEWIYIALKDKTDSIIEKATGTTFKEVSGSFMERVVIPLPPLTEQQRIVAKVDELMTLCEELKQARLAPIAKAADRIIAFPVATDKQETLGMAARGTADDLSQKARQTIDNLFEEED